MLIQEVRKPLLSDIGKVDKHFQNLHPILLCLESHMFGCNEGFRSETPLPFSKLGQFPRTKLSKCMLYFVKNTTMNEIGYI